MPRTWNQLTHQEQAMHYNRQEAELVAMALFGYQLDGISESWNEAVRHAVAEAVSDGVPWLAGAYIRDTAGEDLRVAVTTICEGLTYDDPQPTGQQGPTVQQPAVHDGGRPG